YYVKTINGVKLSTRAEGDMQMGVVQRNNLIAELTEALTGKQETLEKMEAALVELDAAVEKLKADSATYTKEYNELNTKFVALKSSLVSREDGFGSTSARLKILAQRKTEISGLRLDLIESDEKLQNQ